MAKGGILQYIVHDWTMLSDVKVDGDRVAAAHFDGLLHVFQIVPFAIVLVLSRLYGVIQALDVIILGIGAKISDAPANVGVVAGDDAGHAGQRKADDVETAAVQANGVPDRRHGQADVDVVGDDRLATFGH